MKRFISSIVCVIMLFSMVNIASAYTDVMKVGDTRTYHSSDAPTSYPAYGAVSRSHSWYTTDSSVVQVVSYNGASCTIKAVGSGTATVGNKQTLSYVTYGATGKRACYEGGFGDSWVITVNPVDPTGISLPDKFEVVAESYGDIKPTFSPSNAMSDLTWSSSKTSVATVDAGTVYGVAPGTATIMVTTANGFSDTCDVTVTTPQNVFSVVSPVDGRENVDKNTEIKFTYNNKLTQGTAYSSIVLYDNTSPKKVSITKTIEGKNLIITPSNPLSPGHSYTATVPEKALSNLYGVKNSAQVTTTFRTAPLAVERISPVDGSFDVDPGKVVTVKFDAPVEKGSGWNDIRVTDAEGNNVFADSSVSGDTLTISPKTSWDYYTEYKVSIPAGAVACDRADSESDIAISFKTIRNADVVYPPEYSIENGKLVITAEPDTLIYYTTDGGIPLVSGKLYTLPVAVPYNVVHVRAVAVRNGKTSVESQYDYLCSGNLFATALGCGGNDSFNDVSKDKDGYVVVGRSNSEYFDEGDWEDATMRGYYDAVIAKYDKSNNLLWKKNFGGEGADYFSSVATTDDGYVAVGYSDEDSFGTGDWQGFWDKGYDTPVIVKFDKNGYVIWKNSFGGNVDGYGQFVKVVAEEDGYVAAGWAYWPSDNRRGTDDWEDVYGKGDEDGIIVKFDTDGNVVWKKNFGGIADDEFVGMAKTDDGYVAVGFSMAKSFSDGDWTGIDAKYSKNHDSIIVKFDKNGNVVWKKNFGGISGDEFYGVAALTDGYVAVGYSDKDSFGTGDWENESMGKGCSYSVAVKYDKNGNVVWKKNFSDGNDEVLSVATAGDGFATCGLRWINDNSMGAFVSEFDNNGNQIRTWLFDGDDDDEFYAVEKLDNGNYIGVGYSYSTEFDYDGASEIENKGGRDSIAVQFSASQSAFDEFISYKTGKVAIAGNKKVVKGDEITVPLYFTPESETNAVSVKLAYPRGISFFSIDSDYEFIYVEETNGGVTVTADLSDVNDRVPAGENCLLANLIFVSDSNLDEGDCSIFVDVSETFYLDEDYNTALFKETGNYNFTVVPLIPKAISVSGNSEISGPTQYKAFYVPENAEAGMLEWSVSDERIATIDNNGLLTPLKNGEVTVILTEPETHMTSRFDVIISNIRTYINDIKTDIGVFEKEYSSFETERTLYVPKGTTNLKLTLDYNAGNATSGGGIFFKNIAKQITLSNLPYKLTLTKKESGCISTDYIINIVESPEAELIPDIQMLDKEIVMDIMSKTYGDAMLVLAVYNGKTLKNISTTDLPAGEFNVILRTPLIGNKLKIILIDKETLSPLCKNYVVNY